MYNKMYKLFVFTLLVSIIHRSWGSESINRLERSAIRIFLLSFQMTLSWVLSAVKRRERIGLENTTGSPSDWLQSVLGSEMMELCFIYHTDTYRKTNSSSSSLMANELFPRLVSEASLYSVSLANKQNPGVYIISYQKIYTSNKRS